MSPILPNKELSMFIIGKNSWNQKNIEIIKNILHNNENILICVSDKNNELITEITKYFWKQIGNQKITIIEIPQIKTINLVSNSDFEVNCYDCDFVNKSEDKIF